MKKLVLSAAVAASLAAAPAIAQEAPAADPFISTQGESVALGVVGGMTLLVLIAASSDSSSGTD